MILVLCTWYICIYLVHVYIITTIVRVIHRRIYKYVWNTSYKKKYCRPVHMFFSFIYFFYHHFYFPAQLGGGFTLRDLLDKPWSQVSSLLPPGTCLQSLSRIGFSTPTARRFSSNVANSRSRAFRWSIFFSAWKSPYEYVHSVRIELAKLTGIIYLIYLGSLHVNTNSVSFVAFSLARVPLRNSWQKKAVLTQSSGFGHDPCSL